MKTYNDILVSVVMPVYNGALYLKEAIDSILSQTHTNFELIIINDGSTDNSEEIILSYDDTRIHYIVNEKNSGICVTLNKGLDAARGKYIARMDCDDISDINRLSVQVDFMESHLEIGSCGSDIHLFGDTQGKVQMEQNSDLCAAGLLFNPCFAHPTVMWRKDIMERFNIRYNESYRGLEDFVMWWQFAEVTKLANITLALLMYRKHSSQETQNRSEWVIHQSNVFRRYRFSKFGLALSPSEMEVFDNYSFGNFTDFSIAQYDLFVDVMVKLYKSSNYPIITSKKALKILSAKAIAYILSQSICLRKDRVRLLTKAFVRGGVPMLWYLRFLKSYLF